MSKAFLFITAVLVVLVVAGSVGVLIPQAYW